MLARFSTGLKDNLLGNSGFKDALDGGYLHIYAFDGSSTIPGPDDAVDTGGDYTLLATISASGGTDAEGLDFAAPSGGVIQKDSGQTWNNATTKNLVTGQAAFYVFDATEHDGNDIQASTTVPRIVGPAVAVSAGTGSLLLSNLTLTFDQTTEIAFFNATVGS